MQIGNRQRIVTEPERRVTNALAFLSVVFLVSIIFVGAKEAYSKCTASELSIAKLTDKLAQANLSTIRAEDRYKDYSARSCGLNLRQSVHSSEVLEFCKDESYPKDKIPSSWEGTSLSHYSKLAKGARDHFTRSQAKVEAARERKPFFCKGR